MNLIDTPDGLLGRVIHTILNDLYPHVDAVQGPVSSRGLANILLVASPTPLAPLTGLPEHYQPATITMGRAFTDDRGRVGHRWAERIGPPSLGCAGSRGAKFYSDPWSDAPERSAAGALKPQSRLIDIHAARSRRRFLQMS